MPGGMREVTLPTIHPNLLCSSQENGRRAPDSCHPMWPVIALKVHTVSEMGRKKHPIYLKGDDVTLSYILLEHDSRLGWNSLVDGPLVM